MEKGRGGSEWRGSGRGSTAVGSSNGRMCIPGDSRVKSWDYSVRVLRVEEGQRERQTHRTGKNSIFTTVCENEKQEERLGIPATALGIDPQCV